ncbi:hypothetical protein NPIL_130181 [Nephila pilipes]|uniref:Uncharacterized protein n=1 Tax=Nephila pilipes TaxID=299642 RepID=A0A8X6NME1_NEPPI|nr:hypothetical protein NPIL_130181 [Nephila pilipes]
MDCTPECHEYAYIYRSNPEEYDYSGVGNMSVGQRLTGATRLMKDSKRWCTVRRSESITDIAPFFGVSHSVLS